MKINNIQEYDPYDQIKKEELSGDIGKFPPVQWLTKEELKAYESLESYSQFASG